MQDIDSIIYCCPKYRITIFHYPWLIWLFVIAALSLKTKVVLNLPVEVQYPYLYYHWDRGLNFISYAENLKKLFNLKLYWTNCLPKQITFASRGEDLSRLTVSWDFIPKNINLLINSKIIKRGGEKAKQFLQLREGSVKFV